jgi:hypothetical protein
LSPRSRAAIAPRRAEPAPRPFLYVHGPRDREIIVGWARPVTRQLAERVRASPGIRGGRRPARAREHLADVRAEHGTAHGLCVLDRDGDAAPPPEESLDGLETMVWGRRHIESYLLVPAALRRVLRDADPRALRALAHALPDAGDERGWRELDAKRRLAANGPRFPWGRLARALRDDELHPDVHAFLARLAALFGVAIRPAVVHRG